MKEHTESTRNIQKRRIFNRIALLFFIGAAAIGIISLVLLLVNIFLDGASWLNWEFLSSTPSRHPEEAGIRVALLGTLWIGVLTALLCFPLGIASAIWLEEYASDNWFVRLIKLNIANLAGVPSIIYGLIGLTVFVGWFGLGRSVLAGALTMTLLVLPLVILTTQEALRSVPRSLRMGAYALGATKWQVTQRMVVPAAFPGILTGIIFAIARAVGEAAPMIAIAALVYITANPDGPLSRFTVLPIQIFNWISRPQQEFHGLAAAGIIVLLLVLITLNSVAVFLRNKFQRKAED